jgi:alpha-mannosidase
VFADGLYPDAEHSKLRWEGCDGTVIEAMTRIPLAADSATSYLRLPGRIAESMQQDQVAAVVVARWPEVKTPWFDDLHRIHKYAPVLGRFITFDNFFAHTDAPGRLSRYEQREYLSPFLYHSTALQEPDPISRYAEHALRRHRFDAARWYRNVASLLLGKQIDDRAAAAVELQVEAAGPEGDTERQAHASAALQAFEQESATKLADVILHQAEREPGVLLLNPLSFPRRVSIEVPALTAAPPIQGPVKAVQFDESHKLVTVDVPAAGYAWVGSHPARLAESSGQPGPATKGATVVEHVLRNEFFEVFINEATGGIARIKEHGRKPNRLSQQLAYRFPRERKFVRADGEEEATEYSEMRCQSIEVTSAGPSLAEITTKGEIVDQQFNTFLAEFRQRVRVWHGRPVVELDLELDIERLPDSDPWKNYYASRFAWNDSTAALTRSVLQGAHGIEADRFESLDYLEIAEDEQRTTIVFFGLPFHRKTGMRMCDTLLVTPGETRRKFRFAIVVDVPYPLQAALDAMSPVAVVPTSGGPPSAGPSGWFFNVDAKNVQLIQVMDLLDEPRSREVWEPLGAPPVPQGEGFAVRLLETEGRARQVKLQCWRTPVSARKRDFLGRTISTAVIRDDAVLIDMGRYEIADVELRFGP